MLEKIVRFLKKPTSRDIVINTVGNYLNVFFVAFFAFLLVRVMKPSSYGVLSVLLGIAYVLANILDFGTTASIYSYLPPLIEKRTGRLYVFLKTILVYQTAFSAIVITLLFVFFPLLDKVFFKTGAPKWELYVTTFSVLFFIWQNYAINALNAAKQFFKANIFLNLSNLFKTFVIVALIPLKMVNVGSIIFVFGILGPAIFFLLLMLQKKTVLTRIFVAKIDQKEFRFGYTFTFFIASQFFNLATRMDLFLLSCFFSKSPEVGYYGLAQKIILTVLTSVASITQVLSPRFTNIKSKNELLTEIKHAGAYLLIPTFLFLVLFFTPKIVFDIFFTSDFIETYPITRLLSLSYIIYPILNLPFLFLLYTVKKPSAILSANMAVFAGITIGSYYLIPKMGVSGPPIALAASFFASGLILSYFSLKEYRKLKFT